MNIPTKSRTHDEIFQSWKNSPLSSLTRWAPYWENYIQELIAQYRKDEWWMIITAPNEKRPFYKWGEIPIPYSQLYEKITKKYNIGVNLNKSRLYAIDLDSNEIPPKLRPLFESTYSVITKSSHYHLYFKADILLNEKNREKIKKRLFDYKFKDKDDHIELRGGEYSLNQLTILPPSYIHDEKTNMEKRYYEFFNQEKLMKISELLRLIK